jgi:hypothetical protein
MIVITLSKRALGATASIAGVMAIFLLTIPYYLFPQFYVPKTTSYLGYLAPAGVEGWAFLVSGLILLCITVFLVLKLRKNAIIR